MSFLFFRSRLFPEPTPTERAAGWLSSELARPPVYEKGPPIDSAIPASSVRCDDVRRGNEHKPKEQAQQAPSKERTHNNLPARITRSRLTVILTECCLVANALFVAV